LDTIPTNMDLGVFLFASPGHLRGLTLQHLFQRVLAVGAPHLFMSSFNEHIGGRQAPASKARIAFNMGLPNDSQRMSVWVDSYASEFSRDVEPTFEGGSRVWEVTASCVRMYKEGRRCEQSPDEACCTVKDKEVFVNVWSLIAPGGVDNLLTHDANERQVLVSSGWRELCSPIVGPSLFCVNTSDTDGRSGPFIIYDVNTPQPKTIPLYRCIFPTTKKHFFSIDSKCEGQQTEAPLGYIATERGGETLRALRRCKTPSGGHVHALDLECDIPDTGVLGFVR